MDSSSAPKLSGRRRAAAESLAADLNRVFGTRLHCVVAYGPALVTGDESRPLHTLALVEHLAFDDLAACSRTAEQWTRLGLAVPLLLTRSEFYRSLDVFPIEYGSIIARHVVVIGQDPFADAHVSDADVRRGCELQAKSHLIHLREGFLESRGDPRDIAHLVSSSAPAFRTLLTHIARLENATTEAASDTSDEALAAMFDRHVGIPATLVKDVLRSDVDTSGIADPTALLSRYIAAIERIWEHVDAWKRR